MYQAANWHRVGETQARGSATFTGPAALPKKPARSTLGQIE
ncbi:MAG: hypothetical protein L0H73_08200 [Nitrococcus sp.]|nr:hypothetical protein [Nitrococcus sp.]